MGRIGCVLIRQIPNGSHDFFFSSWNLFFKFFRYESIETQALTFLSHIFSASAGVNMVVSVVKFSREGDTKLDRFSPKNINFCGLVTTPFQKISTFSKNIVTFGANSILFSIPSLETDTYCHTLHSHTYKFEYIHTILDRVTFSFFAPIFFCVLVSVRFLLKNL